jgi:hypothetical protein
MLSTSQSSHHRNSICITFNHHDQSASGTTTLEIQRWQTPVGSTDSQRTSHATGWYIHEAEKGEQQSENTAID